MSNPIDGEIMIRLDTLTLIHLKMQQLDMNKPRPDNYYAIMESLTIEYDNCRDGLIETLIEKNVINVQEKIKAK